MRWSYTPTDIGFRIECPTNHYKIPAIQEGSGLHPKPLLKQMRRLHRTYNVRLLIIRIGFWGRLYYKYNKESPKYTKPEPSRKSLEARGGDRTTSLQQPML